MCEIDFSSKNNLVREIENNIWETWANFGAGPNCTLHDNENLLWFETPIPLPIFNGILKFQFTQNIDKEIDRIIDHFKERNAPFFWIVTTSSLPEDLPDRLQKKNMHHAAVLTGMTRLLKNLPEIPPLPHEFKIRKVLNPDDAESFIEFVVDDREIPNEHIQDYRNIIKNVRLGQPDSRMHMWQILKDDEPVSKAGMYLTDTSASIHGVATKPEARRLGLARILNLVALRDAQSRGYSLSVLGATPMAVPLYESLGYVAQAKYHFFVGNSDTH